MLKKLFSLFKDEPDEIPEDKIAGNYFEKFPDDILKYKLFAFSDIKTAAKFALASKKHHQLFKSQIDLSLFIHHVAFGEQDEAEAILKRLHDLNDDKSLHFLLNTKMDVTDISGKQFKPITAFQYALWALDSHMWNMLLQYLPPDKAKSQLDELELNGVNYTIPASNDQSKPGEQHFDFAILLTAFQEYLENYKKRNAHQRIFHWCHEVGGAQKNVPAHIAHEYYRPDRSFCPTPHFLESTLPRQFDFPNDKYSSWYDRESGMGTTFAMLRKQNDDIFGCSWASEDDCMVDYLAIASLRKAREHDLAMLKTQLHIAVSKTMVMFI